MDNYLSCSGAELATSELNHPLKSAISENTLERHMPIVSIATLQFLCNHQLGKRNNSREVQSKVCLYKAQEQLVPAADKKISYHFIVLIKLVTIKFVKQLVYTHSCHTTGPFRPTPRALRVTIMTLTFYRKVLST